MQKTPFFNTFRSLSQPLTQTLVLCAILALGFIHSVWAETQYTEVEWLTLLPADDLEALQNPPSYLNNIADGSPEDLLGGGMGQQQSLDIFSDSGIAFGDEFTDQADDYFSSSADNAYEKALRSTDVVEELDGERVRIPGFIVPIDFDDELNVIEFFLVPYFGACIHLPPPPPNQMIHVKADLPIKLNSLYVPYWISGELSAGVTVNQLGISAYTMTLEEFEMYDGYNGLKRARLRLALAGSYSTPVNMFTGA